MEKHTFIFPKSWLMFTCIASAIFGFLLNSCNSNKVKADEKDDLSSAKPIYMNCVKIDSSQIAEWVSKGWTNPNNTDTLVKKILLQFYSPDATKSNKNMKLVIYPAKRYLDIYTNGMQYADIFADSCKLKLTGKFILGNNYIRLKKQNIMNPDGTLKNFKYLLLKPKQGAYGDYVYFNVITVVDPTKSEGFLTAEDSDPCPKFCTADDPE